MPADAKEIANVVNEAIISVGKDEVHDLYLSINAEFETSYFKRNPNMTLAESREKHAGIPVEYRRYKSKYEEKLRDSASERIEKPIEYKYEEEDRPIRPTQPIEANKYSETRRTNEHVAFPLTSNRVEISTIREWLHNIEESIDKNLEKSDEYIELEHITVLKVEIRKLIKKGGAYVFLKHPDKHPDIYCPEGDADCAFLILSYLNLLNFKDHQTIHQVKQNHLIPPFVSMRHLESISRELTTPVQFVVHKVQDNGFFTTKSNELDRRPNKNIPEHAIRIHIGYIDRHYFYAKTAFAFRHISRDDFDSFHTRKDFLISSMRTVNPVPVEDLKICNGIDEDEDENEECL